MVPDGIAFEPIDENAHQMGGGEEPHNEQQIRPENQVNIPIILFLSWHTINRFYSHLASWS